LEVAVTGLKRYTSICMEGVKEINDELYSEWPVCLPSFEKRPPENEAAVLTSQPHMYLVGQWNKTPSFFFSIYIKL
jgi:hypothetical protein